MRTSRNINVASLSAVGAVALALIASASDNVYARNGERQRVMNREDVRDLPRPLRERLGKLAARPHTFEPMRAFSEADDPSQLFQYYLLDTISDRLTHVTH